MLDDVLCQLQATQHNIELVQALHSRKSSPSHLGTSPVQVVRVLRTFNKIVKFTTCLPLLQ